LKRTPLQRHTPLRTRPRGIELTRPDPVRIDLSGATEALTRQQTPRSEFTGPVAPETNNRPRTGDGSFSAVVRQTILDRDHYRCQRCGMNVDTGIIGHSIQHRIARKMGGTNEPHISRASNGLLLCGSGTTGCHGLVEAEPAFAAAMGYAVESWADPTTVPYCRFDGWWVLLDDRGAAHMVTRPLDHRAHDNAARLTPDRKATP
jgi:hypothetical protein